MIIVAIDFYTDLTGTTKESFLLELQNLLNDSYTCKVKVVGIQAQEGFDEGIAALDSLSSG